MSKDIIGLINRSYNLEEVVFILNEKLGIKNIELGSDEVNGRVRWTFVSFFFEDAVRSLSVTDTTDKEESKLINDGMAVTMGCKENSVDIITSLVEEFGGYICSEANNWIEIKKNSTLDMNTFLKNKSSKELRDKLRELNEKVKKKEKEIRNTKTEIEIVKKAVKEITNY